VGLFTKMRMKEPVRGTAQVVSVTAHRGDSSWQDIQMTLSVRAEGVPPTTVRHRGMCRADRWPVPGQQLPVTLDRRKPERLKVEWDEADDQPQPGVPGMPGAVDLGALQQAFPGATIQVESHTLDASDQPDVARQVIEALGGDDPGDDRIEQLERLAKLHDSGALTDAEFAAEKARVLGGGA
jgi:Short C-terminal domain